MICILIIYYSPLPTYVCQWTDTHGTICRRYGRGISVLLCLGCFCAVNGVNNFKSCLFEIFLVINLSQIRDRKAESTRHTENCIAHRCTLHCKLGFSTALAYFHHWYVLIQGLNKFINIGTYVLNMLVYLNIDCQLVLPNTNIVTRH